jgi:hypothetical protein
MKSSLLLGCSCFLLAGIAAAAETNIPHGTLTIEQNWIRVGAKPQLSWEIDYPAPVTNLVDVAPPNVITPKKDLKMKVRILSSSFQQAKSNNGHGNNADGVDSSNPGQGSGGPNGTIDPSNGLDDELKGLKVTYLPVEVLWSLNGSNWSSIYYGTQKSLKPSKVVLETTVKQGSAINFAGRGWRDGEWLSLYNTAAPTPNVVVLKNGDQVPSTATIESYLSPYMDPVTRIVKIGEHDLIMLVELGQSSTSNIGFDLQDLVVLMSFE